MFLGLLGTLLIAFGLSRSAEFAGLPLIFLGTLLAILAGFHPRISGALGIGKFQVPIIAETQPEEPEPPPSTRVERERPPPNRPPSLRQVRDAAQNPATERRRD